MPGLESAGVIGDSKPFSLFALLCTELARLEIARGFMEELGGSTGSLLGAGVTVDLTAGDGLPGKGVPVVFFAKNPRMLACFPALEDGSGVFFEAAFGVFLTDPFGVDMFAVLQTDDVLVDCNGH